MSKDFQTFDEKFSVALTELNIRALLIGGVACNIYGSTRYSEDVDWWMDPTQGLSVWIDWLLSAKGKTQENSQIVRLRDRQTLKFPNQESSQDKTEILAVLKDDAVIRLQSSTGKVDVFYMPNNLEDFEAVWNRAKLWDGTLRVLCIQDLILTKTGTNRQKDIDDIRFLSQLPTE